MRRRRRDPRPDGEWRSQIEQLARQAQPHGLEIKPEAVERLTTYCCRIELSNIHHNLVSRADLENIVQKHVAASLTPLLVADTGSGRKWVDVGSGAGFPGLVLALVDPEREVTLIEGSHKRCVFLDGIARDLGLRGVRVIAARVETVLERQQLLGAFDLLMARAVADLTHTLSAFGALVRPGGQILTYKGPLWSEEVGRARSMGLLDNEAYRLEQVLQIPWTQGRILLIRKQAAPAA
ncbi:MAG: 16S rRNA (guanine(527)-N(7))-methyltransferase RsmG [Candidatus Eisenbacteria bacterium]|nr:16S rRNA (guanine(527)-N(7))-methyltransferase RsmG [Candidatus Eisenbacteria bacterium]